jgi:hypothetical protein
METSGLDYLDAKQGQVNLRKMLLKGWKEVMEKTVEKK